MALLGIGRLALQRRGLHWKSVFGRAKPRQPRLAEQSWSAECSRRLRQTSWSLARRVGPCCERRGSWAMLRTVFRRCGASEMAEPRRWSERQPRDALARRRKPCSCWVRKGRQVKVDPVMFGCCPRCKGCPRQRWVALPTQVVQSLVALWPARLVAIR